MNVPLNERNTEIHASKAELILIDMVEVNFKFDITEVAEVAMNYTSSNL
jgi:hypothetical protein